MSAQQAKALNQVLRYLSFRDRTCGEITSYLQKKGYPDNIVEATINQVMDLGYLDDRRFIQQWLSWRETKSMGILRIRHELKAKGISLTLIEEELQHWQGEDEYTKALTAAKKKLIGYTDKNPRANARRIAGFLQRNGFTNSVVCKVLNELFDTIPFA